MTWKLPMTSLLGVALCVAAGCSSQSMTTAPTPAASTGEQEARGGRAATTGVVYVTSQGLYYDTFVVKDPLPYRGRFQKIEPSATPGVGGQTMWGPGDPGYLGGRWWMDSNGNGVQDPTDHYFLCPLLGPGRATP